MLLYHASTVRIEEFYVPYGGIHAGGRFSALEAALRKVRSHDADDVLDVYVHLLEVDVGRSVQTLDLGSCDEWRTAIKTYSDEGYNSLEYKNTYEPDLNTSFVLWDPSRITVLQCDVLSQDEAEDILNEFYETHNIY